MNKIWLALLAMCLGVIGYALGHHWTGKAGEAGARVTRRWQAVTNDLAASQAALATLQEDIQRQRERLRAINRYWYISPEMLEILEGKRVGGHGRAWAELRQQLGVGWDASPDYVLVSKQVIGNVWFNKLGSRGEVSDDSVNLLNLSAEERAAVNAAMASARQGPWFNATTNTPSDDMLAQFSIVPPDAAFVAARSNAFTADITAAIGTERADLFLKDAWRELRNGLAPSEVQTMTLREIEVDGQPDLLCEEAEGTAMSTMPVRYAHYPAFPLLKLFPGGWDEVAKSFNFELPSSFHQP